MTNKTSKLLKMAGISALIGGTLFGGYKAYNFYDTNLKNLGYSSNQVEGTSEELVLFKRIGESVGTSTAEALKENYKNQESYKSTQ